MNATLSLSQYYTTKQVCSEYRISQLKAVEDFFNYCNSLNTSFKEFTPIQANSYFQHLKTKLSCLNMPYSNSRINDLLNAVRQFYVLEVKARRMNINPFSSIKNLPVDKLTNSYGSKALTLEEVKYLFDATENMREKVILHLFYSFGFRRKEAQEIQLSDINFQHNRISVRNGKGGKSRTVEVSKKVMNDIKEYIIDERVELLNGKESDSLIVSKLSRKTRGNALYKKVLEIAERTSISKRVVPHLLRASIATHYIDNGVEPHIVQAILGHSVLDTTQLYTTQHKPRK